MELLACLSYMGALMAQQRGLGGVVSFLAHNTRKLLRQDKSVAEAFPVTDAELLLLVSQSTKSILVCFSQVQLELSHPALGMLTPGLPMQECEYCLPSCLDRCVAALEESTKLHASDSTSKSQAVLDALHARKARLKQRYARRSTK